MMEKIEITRKSVEGMSRQKLEDTVFSMYNDCISFKKRIAELEAIVAEIGELRKLANAERYSPSTEAIQYLFPELEAIIQYGRSEVTEKGSGNDAAHEPSRRKARRPNLTLPANAEVCIIDDSKDAPKTRMVDGCEYVRGEDAVVLKLGFIPSKRRVVKHIYPTWVPAFEPEAGDRRKIVGFANDAVDKLAVDESMLADILVSKFDDHIPLYRYEEISRRNGLPLTRQTMSNWLLAYYGQLSSFARFFSDRLFDMKAINQDETPVEVLDVRSPSGKVSSSSFAVIRIGSTFDEESRSYRRIACLSYSSGRSREKLFGGYDGYRGALMTDGLKSYYGTMRIDQQKHASCWVHAVRRLKKYLSLNRGDATVSEILVKHAELYRQEETLRKKLEGGLVTRQEFIDERMKVCRPIVDQIFSIVDTNYPDGHNFSSDTLKAGISYLKSYREHLYNYLYTVELTPDNNIAERVAKAYATGRNYVLNGLMSCRKAHLVAA